MYNDSEDAWNSEPFRRRSTSIKSSWSPQKLSCPYFISAGWAQEARHHRHWQRALSQAAILNLASNSDNSAVLGGTLDLHGTNISLACFHGINFKSKSWALFSLKEPMISFATESQRVPNSESKYSILT